MNTYLLFSARDLEDKSEMLQQGVNDLLIGLSLCERPEDLVDISEILKENYIQREEDIDNYMNPEILEKMKKRSQDIAMYMSQLG